MSCCTFEVEILHNIFISYTTSNCNNVYYIVLLYISSLYICAKYICATLLAEIILFIELQTRWLRIFPLNLLQARPPTVFTLIFRKSRYLFK